MQVGTEKKIVFNGLVCEDVPPFRNEHNPAFCNLMAGEPLDWLSLQEYFAGCGLDDTCDGL